ncbi:hypothetical protein WP8W19C03_31180 [Aeromonas veronii]|uniref:hypothetical protein n=1 Tax=Aeromonas TaxID=642 RepID=UPI0015DC7FE6|nr:MULTISPECIES: hypothetical protein [Aeromonas]EKP0314293.1 hypothetical protein [Aeromonas veronii]BBT96424.1 hypothetical protein WP8W19C03_31180 [Aeromonas veronii]
MELRPLADSDCRLTKVVIFASVAAGEQIISIMKWNSSNQSHTIIGGEKCNNTALLQLVQLLAA